MAPTATKLTYADSQFVLSFGRIPLQPDPAGRLPRQLAIRPWAAGPAVETARRVAGSTETLVGYLERQQLAGCPELVSARLEELDAAIDGLDEQIDRLGQLLQRAHMIRDRHEPTARRRQR